MKPFDSQRRTRPWPRVEVVQPHRRAANTAAYERTLRKSRRVRLATGIVTTTALVVLGLTLVLAGYLGCGV